MPTKNLSWGRDPLTNILDAFYVPPSSNTAYRFPAGYYETDTPIPLTVMYPRPDSETYVNAHHRVAYTAMKWQCPVRCLGGSNPRFYEIVQAPSGVTLGEFLSQDVNGNYIVDPDYGLLTWTTPTVGLHSIKVRCTDQNGDYKVISFTVLVSTAKHLFVAPTARGTGDGSSYSNAMASATAILSSSTAPALGKVLVLCGGTYTSAHAMILNKTTGAGSVIGYPDEVAIWQNKVDMETDDCSVGFVTFQGVGTNDFGVVGSYDIVDRIIGYYNTFNQCTNTNVGGSNNQSCYGLSGPNGVWREYVCFINNTYIDCDELHAFDIYKVDKLLSQCDTWITSNDPSVATSARSVWFTKARYTKTEISFNTYDNPHVSGHAAGIIAPYNAAEPSGAEVDTVLSVIEYNFVRCASTENGIYSNGAENLNSPWPSQFVITNTIRRNTVINGGIGALNYDYEYNLNRRTLVYNNVMQRSTGANMTVTPISGVADSVWFENPSMLYGTSLVDATGVLNAGNSTHRGKKGAQVYKP